MYGSVISICSYYMLLIYIFAKFEQIIFFHHVSLAKDPVQYVTYCNCCWTCVIVSECSAWRPNRQVVTTMMHCCEASCFSGTSCSLLTWQDRAVVLSDLTVAQWLRARVSCVWTFHSTHSWRREDSPSQVAVILGGGCHLLAADGSYRACSSSKTNSCVVECEYFCSQRERKKVRIYGFN